MVVKQLYVNSIVALLLCGVALGCNPKETGKVMPNILLMELNSLMPIRLMPFVALLEVVFLRVCTLIRMGNWAGLPITMGYIPE